MAPHVQIIFEIPDNFFVRLKSDGVVVNTLCKDILCISVSVKTLGIVVNVIRV